MSTMWVPKSITNKMDASFRRFWWGNDDQNTKAFTPKCWKSICQSKSFRGLGLKNNTLFNKVLISKYAWHIINNTNSLYKNMLVNKYLRNTSFLEVNPKPIDSWFWNCLLKQR